MSSEATTIGIVLVALTNIGSFILLWRKLTGVSETRRIEPSPLEVRAAAEFARADHLHTQYMLREECRSAHAAEAQQMTGRFTRIETSIEKLGEKLEASIMRMAEQAEGRARKIHERIDPMAQEVTANARRLQDHLNASHHGG
jgi:TolA-binding protein